MTLSRLYLILLVSFILSSEHAAAQWQAGMLPAGHATSIASDGAYLYASTDSAGVFRSADLGGSWQAVNTGLPDTNLRAVRAQNGMLYAMLSNGFSGAIFLSNDHGNTWTAPTSQYFGFVYCMVPYQSSMLMGTWYGVARSTDHGESWPTMASTNLPSNATVTAIATRGTTIFAAVSSSSVGGTGVFRTTNNGAKWVAAGLTGSSFNGLAATPSALFAVTASNELNRSTDNGGSWSVIGDGLPSATINGILAFGNTLILATDQSILASTTSGNSWTNISGNLQISAAVTAIDTADNQLWIATGRSLWHRPLTDFAAVATATGTDVHVWPNPSRGVVYVDLDGPYERIDITDIFGREMPVPVERTTTQLTIDTHKLCPGTYFLHLTESSAERIMRLVVE